MKNHDDHSGVIAVSASAGTGKTFALSRRYVSLAIRAILGGKDSALREILAITFTNKASHEMKSRIIEMLKKIALDGYRDADEKKAVLSGITTGEAGAKKAAAGVLGYIFGNFDHFSVKTIDSFMHSLLGGCAYRVGLSSNFKIETNYRDLVEFSIDTLLDMAEKDEHTRKLFRNFIESYVFVEGKKDWMIKDDIISLMSSLFAIRNTYGGEFRTAGLSGRDVAIKRGELLELIGRLRRLLGTGANGTFVKKLDSILAGGKGSIRIDSLGTSFLRDSVPYNKGFSPSEDETALWGIIKAAIACLCEYESAYLFDTYIEIFDKMHQVLIRAQTEEDVMFLSELNRKARMLFEENITVAEVYYMIAASVAHFLIDEFQDTSVLQWMNLEPMAEESLSRGGSLYYVGDLKQSIFRFRGGEPGLFHAVGEKFKMYGVKSESLSVNFRSGKNVVEFNNALFSGESIDRMLTDLDRKDRWLSDGDRAGIKEVFKDARSSHRPAYDGGYVFYENVYAKNRDEFEDILKKKIPAVTRDCLSRFKPEDIAVLTVKNREMELVSAWLTEAGIPVFSQKTADIREHRLIRELIAALRFLAFPIDNVAFSAFILGDIFTMLTGIPKDELRRFIMERRDRLLSKTKCHLYKEFKDAYPVIWDRHIREFHKKVGTMPLYEFLVSIVREYRVLGNFPESQAYIMQFLEMAKAREERYTGLPAFLEHFENANDPMMYASGRTNGAVNILTVHKAKGLEFRACVLPFLAIDAEVGASDTSGQETDKPYRLGSYLPVITRDGIRLMNIKSEYARYSERIRTIYREEFRRSIVDELDTVYVGMTRAREELHVFIPQIKTKGANHVKHLFPGEKGEFGIKEVESKDAPGPVQGEIEIPPRDQADWLRLLENEFSAQDDVVHRKKMAKGDMYHYVLSFVGDLSGAGQDDVLKRAMEKAASKFPFEEGLDGIRAAVERLLAVKELRDIFFVSDAEVLNEAEIVDGNGETKRVDRLVVRKDSVWIIDYKTAREPGLLESYRDQIERYKEMAGAMFPAKKVRGFLVFIEHPELKEI